MKTKAILIAFLVVFTGSISAQVPTWFKYGVRIDNEMTLDGHKVYSLMLDTTGQYLRVPNSYLVTGLFVKQYVAKHSGSGGIWGSITGTLSDQTDLNSALNGKEPTISGGTTEQYWRGDKTWQTLPSGLTLTDNILHFNSSTNTFEPHSTKQSGVNFYLGTVTPDGTTRLNLNAHLYSTQLNSGITSITSYNPIGEGALNVYGGDGNGADGIVRIYNNATLTHNEDNNALLELIRICNGSTSYSTSGNIIQITDNPSNVTNIYGKIFSASIDATERISMYPRVPATGTVPAYLFDTKNTLTTTPLLVLKNSGVQKFKFESYGRLISQSAKFDSLIVGTSSMTGANELKNMLVPELAIGGNSGDTTFISNAGIVTHGKIKYTAGTSTTLTVVPGILKDFFTDASTSGTSETDLYSYTLPANILASNGDKLTFKVFGQCNASPTTPVIKFYLGTDNITADDGSTVPETNGFAYTFELIRVSSSVCRVICWGVADVTTSMIPPDYAEFTSKDWTVSNILKITGQAATNDITLRFGYIEYIPAAVN